MASRKLQETLETERGQEIKFDASTMDKTCRSNGFGVGSNCESSRKTIQLMQANNTKIALSKLYSLNKLKSA